MFRCEDVTLLFTEHLGRCPAKTEVAARAVCSDSCGSDADCREEQKCCSTSCGRRCVLALSECRTAAAGSSAGGDVWIPSWLE